MSYFPGDPEPRLAAWPMDPPWRVSELHLGTHCGTHLDAPSHLGGDVTVDQLPLERLIGQGVVIDVTGKPPGARIGLNDLGLARVLLREGAWAIFRSSWDRYWRTPDYLTHPALDPTLAGALVEWGVGLAGMDMLNPDDTVQGESIIHEILLGAGVLIVENLTGLEQLEAGRLYTFSVLPLKLAGLDGAPVRAIAWDGVLPRSP